MINIENELDAMYFKRYDYGAGIYALDPELKNNQRLHKRQYEVVKKAIQEKQNVAIKQKKAEEKRRLEKEKLEQDAREYLQYKVQQRFEKLPRDTFD